MGFWATRRAAEGRGGSGYSAYVYNGVCSIHKSNPLAARRPSPVAGELLIDIARPAGSNVSRNGRTTGGREGGGAFSRRANGEKKSL